jgi:hypothetical protein
MFFKGSRYQKVNDLELTDSGGRVIRYKGIRFIGPATGRAGHTVVEGERLDHIAFRYYSDPEVFWRICDANLSLWPPDLLEEKGRVIIIPTLEE